MSKVSKGNPLATHAVVLQSFERDFVFASLRKPYGFPPGDGPRWVHPTFFSGARVLCQTRGEWLFCRLTQIASKYFPNFGLTNDQQPDGQGSAASELPIFLSPTFRSKNPNLGRYPDSAFQNHSPSLFHFDNSVGIPGWRFIFIVVYF